MQPADQQAIQQVLAGDSSAFGGLVNRYQSRLLGLLFHTCGDRDLAEDMAQEAFARAYQKLHLFSGESQFYTWLARIAMNLLASDRRKKRLENQIEREGIDVALDTQGETQEPSAAAEMDERQRCVHEAIALLDEQRRMVLLLRDFDGLEYEAISVTLDIPVGTVRSRLHRARSELKTILQQKSVGLGF